MRRVCNKKFRLRCSILTRYKCEFITMHYVESISTLRRDGLKGRDSLINKRGSVSIVNDVLYDDVQLYL